MRNAVWCLQRQQQSESHADVMEAGDSGQEGIFVMYRLLSTCPAPSLLIQPLVEFWILE